MAFKFLKLNQRLMAAEGGGAGAGSATPPAGSAGAAATPPAAGAATPPAGDPPPAPGAGDPPPAGTTTDPTKGGEPQNTGGKLTDAEMRQLYEGDFLKSLGVDSFDNLKENLTKWQEYQDSKKTDEQRQADKLTTMETELNTERQKAELLEAKIAAFGSNVKAEYVEDVITLAKSRMKEGTDIGAAIKGVVELYPHFSNDAAGAGQEPPPPRFAGDNSDRKIDENDPFVRALLNK